MGKPPHYIMKSNLKANFATLWIKSEANFVYLWLRRFPFLLELYQPQPIYTTINYRIDNDEWQKYEFTIIFWTNDWLWKIKKIYLFSSCRLPRTIFADFSSRSFHCWLGCFLKSRPSRTISWTEYICDNRTISAATKKDAKHFDSNSLSCCALFIVYGP